MYQNKPQPQVFGTDEGKPDDSAQVEIISQTKGFLGPRMTTANRLALVNPAIGLEVYDTDANLKFFFDGTQWISGGVKGPASSTDNAITRWDGVTGGIVQDSTVKLSDTGVMTEVTQFSNEATVPASLSFNQQSTVLATKPWPTMTSVERDLLTTVQGAVIYNTSDDELQIFDGVDWIPYNIGVYFMIENGYVRDFSTLNLTTAFETITTIANGTLKALNITNNSGNTLRARVTVTGPETIIAPGDAIQIGYRGAVGDVVQIATATGVADEGNIYVNFLGV